MKKRTEQDIKRTVLNMIESNINQLKICIKKEIDHRYDSAILLGYLNMAYAAEILTETEFNYYSDLRAELIDDV